MHKIYYRIATMTENLLIFYEFVVVAPKIYKQEIF